MGGGAGGGAIQISNLSHILPPIIEKQRDEDPDDDITDKN